MIEQLIQISQEKPLQQYTSITDWSVDYYQSTKIESLIDRAIIGGFMSQQLSFSFMAGYQAALDTMFPTIAPNQLKALCVSEEKGVHPKSIQTTLIDNKINGVKTYVTAGSDVEHMLVLCKTDKVVNDRPVLKMVHVSKSAVNAEITDFELPFMKDIKHGKVTFKNTPISETQILEGDGYNRYTKPFRTLEDIFVAIANQSMLLRQAIENQWDEAVRDTLLLSIYTLKKFSFLDLSDEEIVVLVAANERRFEELLPKIDGNIANHSSPVFKADWEMNKRVFSMAKKLKEYRLAKARKTLLNN